MELPEQLGFHATRYEMPGTDVKLEWRGKDVGDDLWVITQKGNALTLCGDWVRDQKKDLTRTFKRDCQFTLDRAAMIAIDLPRHQHHS